ncbi:MAG: hypothetical protein Q9212_006632 [Teloschistes hypoglaucus]
MAPDSPSFSPILSFSSMDDLTSTLKARPAPPPHEEPPLPATASGPTAHHKPFSNPPFHKYLPNIDKTARTSFPPPKPDRNPIPHPRPPILGSLIDTDLQTRNIKNFRNAAEHHDGKQEEEHDMPRGYPYREWRDYGYLALEWVGAMSGQLFGYMESECRLMNGARHTI